MPRNSGGTYTLPAGNPVVTGTVISSTWANTTLTDISTALTDSLSRSGQGGMTATLLLADGAIGGPGLSWTNETTSGLYRAGAGDFRWAIAGADKFQITTNGIRATDGTIANPAISFIADPDTGLYRQGANQMNISVGGTSLFSFSPTFFQITNPAQLQNQDGSAGTPSYSFTSDTDTGIYRIGANDLGFSAGGALRFEINTTGIYPNVQVLPTMDGTVGAPEYSWFNDPDTGLYRSGTNTFVASAGGTAAAQFTLSGAVAQVGFGAGTAAIPSITFFGDVDTGLYSIAADVLAVTAGGALVAQFRNIAGALKLLGADGTAAAPYFTFDADTDTGVYRAGANALSIATGGVQQWIVNTTNIVNGLSTIAVDGAAATPAYSFTGATSTGIYRPAASTQVAISCAGTTAATFGSAGQSLGNTNDTWFLGILSSATASAGGGAALPATVAGFWQVTINGTARKIPYYAN